MSLTKQRNENLVSLEEMQMALQIIWDFEPGRQDEASDSSLIHFYAIMTDALDFLRVYIRIPKNCCEKRETPPLFDLQEREGPRFLKE